MKYIIYVAHPEEQKIKVWNFDLNNKLKLIQEINVLGNPQPMTINNKKKLLYVGIKPNYSILTFKIKHDGKLLKLNSFNIPCSPSYISLDKKVNYMFVASYNNSLFIINKLKENGVPNIISKIVENIKGCHSVNVDLDNKFLFVPALLKDCIYTYSINEKKYFELKDKTNLYGDLKSGPRHMSFHPNKKYFYSINELNSTVDVWYIKNNFFIKIQTLSILPNNNKKKWAADIHISPDGKYLYTCDRYNSLITIFKIKKNGKINIVKYQTTETQPREFEIDIKGNYLVIAGQKSSFISIYKINKSDGTLIHITREISGNNPIWVNIFLIN